MSNIISGSDKSYERKIKHGKGLGSNGTILDRKGREGFSLKVIFEQNLNEPLECLEKCMKQREQQMA